MLLAAVLTAPSARAEIAIAADRPTANIFCSGGICVPTASTALLNSADLHAMLAAGNVTVTTHGAAGVEAGGIRVVSPVAWPGTTLSLVARQSITINQMLTIGGGGLALTTNDGGQNGILLFAGKGHATFQMSAGQLTINGTGYTLVSSLADLAADIAADPGGHYALAHGITATGTYTASPIPTTLTGTLEGLGNTISSLVIAAPAGSAVALMQEVGKGGSVRDLRLKKLAVSVAKSHGGAGGLTVQLASGGAVFDIHVTGTLRVPEGEAAPIALGAFGIIDRSSGDMRITAASAGGLVDASTNASITNSYSGGTIDGNKVQGQAGGIVSVMNGGSIQQSFATIKIMRGANAVAGGIVGVIDSGTIANCYYIGSLSAKSSSVVGGLIGKDSNDVQHTVSASYASNTFDVGNKSEVGGIAGVSSINDYLNTYWDLTLSAVLEGTFEGTDPGQTGLTHQELQSQLPEGLDLNIWQQSPAINGGLPFLKSTPPDLSP